MFSRAGGLRTLASAKIVALSVQVVHHGLRKVRINLITSGLRLRRLRARSSELFKVPMQGLRTLFANRRFRFWAKTTIGLWLLLWLIVACVVQFWLFPRLNDYRTQLADEVGRALGVSVEIGHLSGDWQMLHPRFVLDQVVVFDARHQPSVDLQQIRATLAWTPLLTGSIGFRALDVDAPILDFRRDAAGHLFLGGLPLDGGGDFRVDALLEQGEISLRSHRVQWTDAQRKAATLALQDVAIRLRNQSARHRLDLSFTPPTALGQAVTAKASWIGRQFADWQNWQIDLSLKTANIDLAGWKAWVDYPVPVEQGQGQVDLNISAVGLGVTHVDGSLALSDLKTRLAPELQMLVLKHAASEIDFQKRDDGRLVQLKLTKFAFTDQAGQAEKPADIFIKHERAGQDGAEDDTLSFRASRLDLARLRALAAHLPLQDDVQKALRAAQPAGVLEKLKIKGRFVDGHLTDYAGQGVFSGLALTADNGQRFIKGLSGSIELTQDRGQLILDTGVSTLASPGVLPITEVPLELMTGQINWKIGRDKLAVTLKNLQLKNADMQTEVNGTWSGSLQTDASEQDKAGEIDMKLTFGYANTESAWKYIPTSASADISKWMKASISGGTISDFRIEMQGRVWDMPYGSPVPGAAPESSESKGAPGKFYLGFKTKQLNVKYAEGYPLLEKLNANFAMNQNQIQIVATDGQISGMKFSAIKAEMPDVMAYENHLLVSGQASGATRGVVSFLTNSPVAEHIHHFADGMSAEGDGRLDMALDLNLAVPSDVKINGQYQFQNNQIGVVADTPPVQRVNGSLKFTQDTMDSKDLEGQWLGQPLFIRITTDARGALMDITGRASIAELRQYYGLPIFDQLSGKTDWQAQVAIRGGVADLTINSDLRGLTSSLPEPFNKAAGTALPLTMAKVSGATNAKTPGSLQITRLTLGNAAAATIGTNARGQLVRGRVLVGSGQRQALPDQPGLQLESLKPVDLDFWAKAIGMGPGAAGNPSSATKRNANPLSITIRAPVVTAFGRRFQDMRATVQSATDRTHIQMASRELQGDLDWFSPGTSEGGERGLVQGHLNRLDLTAATDSQPGSKSSVKQDISSLPDLSLKIDDLLWQGKPWGKLSFKAKNQRVAEGQSWRVDPFLLEGPDLKFGGRLNWLQRNSDKKSLPGASSSLTAMDFKLNSPQVGNLLTKLGFPGTVKRGTAQLEGQISWPSNPFSFDPAVLSGNFKMAAKNGQFSKMDPGVGRLLGLLSLQSLPQRFSLDFRDIFSEGLAFESIDGRFDIRDGVMKTSDLEMDTPSARVLMRGETNLANQTQDVRVTVRPALANSVAVGLTVLNPIVGAATFVAQKVLDDPLSKVFSFQYHVTGSWADPLVDKESIGTGAVNAVKDVQKDVQ